MKNRQGVTPCLPHYPRHMHPPVYETYCNILINEVEVYVRVRYITEDDIVFLQQVQVECDNADWLLDLFEDELTEACDSDYAFRAKNWPENAAEARHAARRGAAK